MSTSGSLALNGAIVAINSGTCPVADTASTVLSGATQLISGTSSGFGYAVPNAPGPTVETGSPTFFVQC